MPDTAVAAELYSPEFAPEWARFELYGLAQWINGLAFKDSDFSRVGVPVIKIVEIKNGLSSQTKRTAAKYDPKYFLVNGDMLFCWSGQPETSIDTCRWIGGEGWLNQHIFRVLPDEAVVEKDFFFYLLRYLRPTFVRIARNKQTTGLGHVTKKDLQNLTVALPPLQYQRAVATALGILDARIESNRRIAEMIPRLIRALVCQSLQTGAREVAAADLANFVNGGAYTKGASGTGRMVIRISELNSGPGSSTVYNDIAVPDDRMARQGDILMSWSGSLGIYRWCLDEAIVNQHIFKVVPGAEYPAWLVFDRLDEVMPIFRGIAKDKATTMGHIQRGHLQSTKVQVPFTEAIARLHHRIAPAWERLLVAERETVKLAALRDALLPELLSGRRRVSYATPGNVRFAL